MSELKRLVGAGLFILLAGIIALGGWTALAPLTGAIVAPAFVKIDLNRKVVQHQEGGIVREIRARDGDRVKQGQALIVIEDVRVDASLDLLSIQLIAERARAARLAAEAAYGQKVPFPADVLGREREPRVAEVLERERALFRAAKRSRARSLRCARRSAKAAPKSRRSAPRSPPKSAPSPCRRRSSRRTKTC
jgi:multidrug efflux pump subunit AcrA (membrane-fusion protein)